MFRHIAFDERPAPSTSTKQRPFRCSLLLVALLLTASLVATPASATGGGRPGSANEAWLVDSYRELLGRSADDSGLEYHLDRITAGGRRSRQGVAYGFLFGREGSRREVRRAYTDLLGRSADRAGEEFWTNHLTGRGVLDLRVLLVASDEYHRNAGGSDQAWLRAVYRDLLGRLPDASGQQYWSGRLQAGVARANVVGSIYQSGEALGRRADTYFADMLGRRPSPGERTAAASEIQRHGERHLRARLWSSDEAFETYLDAVWP